MDLDFLFLEYDRGRAVAIVEYKHEAAALQYRTHPTYQALIDLGCRAGVPVFGVRYKADFSNWRAVPLNALAEHWLPGWRAVDMTEREWVTLLYNLRGYQPPEDLFQNSELVV